MSLIKRPNTASMLRARISDLEAQVVDLQAQASKHEATADAAIDYAQNLEAELDCAECEDMAALKCGVDQANYDLLKVQGIYRNELCSNHWRDAFLKCGKSEALCHLQKLFSVLITEREYQLAVAAHNQAFCAADGCADVIADHIAALEAMITDDMDSRCRAYIMEQIAVANA